MWSRRGMMNEAIRVCRKHVPHMLGDLVDSADGNVDASAHAGSGPASAGSKRGDAGLNNADEILDRARVYEDTGNFIRAIDTYLMVTSSMIQSHDRLEEIWENAVRLAMKHS